MKSYFFSDEAGCIKNTIFGPRLLIYETEIFGHIEGPRSLALVDDRPCLSFLLFVPSS